MDNESDDDSVEVAISEGAKVITLKRSAFSFGHSLNYGLQYCSGEIVLILSAHVILLSENFLHRIPGYFKEVSIAGLRFLNSMDIVQVKDSVNKGPAKLYFNDEPDFASLHWKRLLVNHCAAIRRSCWEAQHYDEAVFASEDKLWSLSVLQKGYAIQYNTPLYYAYIKQPSRDARIRRIAIETAAREMITGFPNESYQSSLGGYLAALRNGMRKTYSELYTKRGVAKMIRAIKIKYAARFRK